MSDAPAWARGFDLDLLRQIASVFAADFKPYVHGAFGLPKESAIADAMEVGEACWTRLDNAISGAALAKRLKAASRQADFAGRLLAPQAGDVMVRAIAGGQIERERLIDGLLSHEPAALWIEDFAEHPLVRAGFWDDMGFERVATKVMASSDIKGLWLIGDTAGRVPEPLPPADMPALRVIERDWISPAECEILLAELEAYSESLADPAASPWAQHYSNYNKRQSWTAFALRGFDADDPGFIIKPTEMSRGWKAENPDRLAAQCGDTIAIDHFPETMRVVARLPGRPQRVRLMRLASGNGELSRHADIVDPEAGTADGHTARIHIPLQSPPECRFLGWGLDGERVDLRFPPGALCYLDTRKPHSVINPGAEDRIHLVVDLFSSDELRRLIA